MSTDPETVAVELVAKLDNFDGRLRVSASAFGGAMKQIEASANRAEGSVTAAMVKTSRSVQQAQQASRNLGFQIADIGTQLSAGTSPFLILAQQGPQVANALEGAKGKIGQFATFLSGPWGAALLGATTLLGVFGSKLFESKESVDDLVEKMKEHARQTAQSDEATAAYNRTLEGRIGLEKKLTDELDRQLKSQRELDREKVQEAENQAAGMARTVADLERQVAAQDRLARHTKAVLQGRERQDPNNPVQATQANVDKQFGILTDLQGKLSSARASLSRLQEDVRKAKVPILNDAVEGVLDPVVKATQHYTDEVDKLEIAWSKGSISATEYGARLAKLKGELKAVQDAATQARKAGAADTADLTRFISPVDGGKITGKFGDKRPGHTHAGIDIAVPVGTPVKAPAAGVIIEAGVVPGYGNVVYIDHGRGTISRLGHLSQSGVTKGQVVGQGDIIGKSGGAKGAPGSGDSTGPHLHQEVRVNGRAVDPRKGSFNTDQGALAEKAAAAAKEELQRRQAFLNALAADQVDELDARQALIASAEEIARLEKEAIEVARARKDAQITAQEEEYKQSGGLRGLSEEEAKQRRLVINAIAKNRTELVDRREEERQFRMQEADAQRKLQFQSDSYAVEEELARSQEGVAKTAKERREIGERLIDLQFSEEKLQLQAIIAETERLKIEAERLATKRALSDAEKQELARAQDRATTAQGRLDTLPQRQANAEQGNSEQNAGPLQSYFQSIPDTADEINQALESVAAGGLQTFTDALTDAIVNFKSLEDVGLAVLRSITAELVKMAIQQVILHTIGKTLGSASVAASAVQGAATATAWAPAAALVSLATLGTNSIPAMAAITATTALATALGAVPRKDGGPIFGPGGPRDDKVLMAASPGEYVIKAKSASKLGRAALDRMNLTGELPGHFADGGAFGMVRPNNTPATARGGAARVSMDDDFRREIRSVVRDAAAAMPDVNLYPTLDPGAVLREALSSSGGRRATFEFLSQNSGRVRKSIG